METAAKIASIVSASCSAFMLLWHVVPTVRSKMKGAANGEASGAFRKSPIAIMAVLALLSWAPITGLWVYGSYAPKGAGTYIKFKMGDAFNQRKIEAKLNFSGEYPWYFRDKERENHFWWVIIFEKPFDSGPPEIFINGREADRATYFLQDKTERGVVLNTLAYGNDDLIEIKIPAKE